VNVTGYAYPWDYLDDPAAAPRARDLGVDTVALAATYHASRTVSPLHPTRRVTNVATSSCFVPVRAAAWRGRRLAPHTPTWLDSENAFAVAHEALQAQGLAVDAWIVLTHHDELGYANPDLVVRNAFGDLYPYALCPQNDEVRDYCVSLVEEVLLATQCRGVVLEACGPMGFEHGSVHDKSEFAQWTNVDEALLSLCFCEACRDALVRRGLDIEELVTGVRLAVGSGTTSVETSLSDDVASEVRAFRASLSVELRRRVVERISQRQPNAAVTVHTSADPWATGSFPTSGGRSSLDGVATVVARCWDEESTERELSELREGASSTTHLGGYLRMDRGWSNASFSREKIERYVALGMDELHLYHLGLLSQRGLEDARHVIDVARGI
jgi:hypothetical protein